MIFVAMSMVCFHCVDIEVMNSGTELGSFIRRVAGSNCPLCGTTVTAHTLLCDQDEFAHLSNKSGSWNRGAAPSPGFGRFLAEEDGGSTRFGDVAGKLRAQVAGSHDRRRREMCAKLTEEFSAGVAFSEGERAAGQGDLEQARRAFEFAADSADEGSRVQAEIQLGDLDKANGDLRAASRRYRKAANATNPGVRAIALLYLGIALRMLNDMDGARAAYQDCVDIGDSPARGLAAFRLGTVLQDSGRTAEARDAYEFAVELDTDGSDEAAINLGAIEEAAGRWDRARSLWEYAFTTGDEDVKASAAFNLGRAWEHDGEVKKAKSFYRIAVKGPDRELAKRARYYRWTASRIWEPGR